MFTPVESSVRFPALEAEVARFWKEHGIYEKSLQRRRGCPRFVFYEGPPTANGLPHPGHCLTRAIKDLFPRYRTMRGFYCERKAGWDTHGLPVEVEVCKELGIHSKEEIERFGVEPFIHRCLESVFRYTREWERLTERLGFWVNLDEAYVTYHQSYVESVWWSLKELFDRGLLYQGHKIVWWWAQGGTALSSGEVGQGYREVADPSVYVRFPIVADEGTPPEFRGASLLVWTTTPWTLPSNQFVAVNEEIEYALTIDPELPDGENGLIMAVSGIPFLEYLSKTGKKLVWVNTLKLKGRDLVGLRYRPPFDYYYKSTTGDLTGRIQTAPASAPSLVVHADPQDPMKPTTITRFEGGAGVTGSLRGGGTDYLAWRVVLADFVSTESGTGVVHIAPAFGEIDYELLIQERLRFEVDEGPELICSVAPDGKFTAEAPDYEGRWVKDCDKDICRDLKRRGLLYHQEQYLHEYPFCWRAEEDPLIQYPRRSWFIRTTQFKDEMLANNSQINWLPEHIKEGRFGNFLESNVDWALSRERYWGTPLPIWQCDQTGKMEAVASYAELLAKLGVQGTEAWQGAKKANPALSEHLKVHKPYIDEVTYDSPFAAGARMRRVSEVIDCWYDSGAMPFAQWGYPHTGREQFAQQFPADFISEALDQTRGWFYSQLAISTLLFGRRESEGGRWEDEADAVSDPPSAFRLPPPYPHPFRNCIVLGLMLGEDGGKMSKSKRNYREPDEIFDRFGADALRWYFFANQPPWTSIRYSEQAIKDSIPEFLLRLWNVYSFFVIYANIDGFDPAAKLSGKLASEKGAVPFCSADSAKLGQSPAVSGSALTPAELARASDYRPVANRGELDRWILGELAAMASAVTERMDAYDNYAACQRIIEFVDALSNWYVRRSRDRFWSEDKADPDKLDAYWTLYECLVETCKIVAPFTPFLAEALWQNLAVAGSGQRALESVHLCDFPTGDVAVIDPELSRRMSLVREIVSLGRAARTGAKLKVRQPLSKVEAILARREHLAWLQEHCQLIAEELNVKEVEFTEHAEQYISYSVLPDLKRLGPRLGKRLPALKAALAAADAGALLARLNAEGSVTLELPDGPVALDSSDLQVRLQAKPGWAAAQGAQCVVVLATELTDALVNEGLARELVHAIQSIRKDMSCAYTDRIAIGLVTDDVQLRAATEQFVDYIRGETLSIELTFVPIPGVAPVEVKISSATVRLYVHVRKA